MKRYIDKYALVAEIEKNKNEMEPERDWHFDEYTNGYVDALKEALSIINTLEVKEVNFEKDVRQILSLYYEGINHYNDIIKEEREENGGSDLAIKIIDGVVDARELGIQYVLDKLKAQKGE